MEVVAHYQPNMRLRQIFMGGHVKGNTDLEAIYKAMLEILLDNPLEE